MRRRPIPRACRRTALYHPEYLLPFRGSNRPSVVISDRIDGLEAAWFAGLAHSAYHPDCRLPHLLASQSCNCRSIVENASIRAFLAEDHLHRYLVFCGTRPAERANLRTDADARWQAHPAGGRCHRGFLAGLDAIWPSLAAHLVDRDPRPLLLVGHSLGAALALLASERCRAAAVLAFGAPRIGDAACCRRFADLPCWRFQHGCDIVCHLPPAELGWRHHGRNIYLDDRHCVLAPPTWRLRIWQVQRHLRYIARLPWARSDMVLVPQLADHSIVAYQDALTRRSPATHTLSLGK